MRSLVLGLALLAPLPALCANSFTPDVSDLWWNPAESGWGLNLIQQANVLFGTFFVYGSDGRARWYVASNLASSGPSGDRSQTFRGDLYESTGPLVLSTPFDPASVARRRVGDATVQYTAPNSINLTYTVDGSSTTKALQRQTWAPNDISGYFDGVSRGARSDTCGDVYDYLGEMQVTQAGTTATLQTFHGSPSVLNCSYSGTYAQAGRMSAITGNFTCTGGAFGPSGTFTLSEIEVGPHGFMARLEQSSTGCRFTGHFFGTRATVP
jgi:hypothetical protein